MTGARQCEFENVAVGVWECAHCRRRVRSSTGKIHADCRRSELTCGPGCHLARIFSWFGIRDDGTCGCKSFAAQMDAWGPDGCEQNMDAILAHLREAAEKKGLPYVEIAAKLAVSRAISAARAES